MEHVENLLRKRPSGQHEAIGVAVDHLVDGGGKRIRPALVILSAYLCEMDVDRAIFAAAAVELLHTATLVHDDLIDGALIRRGIETLNAHWSPATTVLTGDYVFARAAHLASQAESILLMQCFSETLMTICNGEVRQMFDGGRCQTSHQEYERRIYAKTASLFSMSTQAGAILAGAEKEKRDALKIYGEQLGLAFQVVDDVLDFVADEERLGKPVGSDLRQGLVTLPVLLFLEDNPDHPSVCQTLEGNSSDKVAWEAIQTVAGSPAIERALAVAQEHADQARVALSEFSHSSYRAALLALVDFTVRRRF
ncbi:MAG: polyprenyl synthetase family protein [Chloroflexota bacterium]|nr:polyprenyl synthetase family protein [Chloroflexota bacterium]